MCLSIVSRQQAPTNEVVEAWGVFVVKEHRSKIVVKTAYTDTTVKLGRWSYREENAFRLFDNYNNGYTTGFHKFVRKSSAVDRRQAIKRDREWASYNKAKLVVVKVYLRGVHTYGYEDSDAVLVADEMLVKRQDVVEALKKVQKG